MLRGRRLQAELRPGADERLLRARPDLRPRRTACPGRGRLRRGDGAARRGRAARARRPRRSRRGRCLAGARGAGCARAGGARSRPVPESRRGRPEASGGPSSGVPARDRRGSPRSVRDAPGGLRAERAVQDRPRDRRLRRPGSRREGRPCALPRAVHTDARGRRCRDRADAADRAADRRRGRARRPGADDAADLPPERGRSALVGASVRAHAGRPARLRADLRPARRRRPRACRGCAAGVGASPYCPVP